MVTSICPPLRLNLDQMLLNFSVCKAKTLKNETRSNEKVVKSSRPLLF